MGGKRRRTKHGILVCSSEPLIAPKDMPDTCQANVPPSTPTTKTSQIIRGKTLLLNNVSANPERKVIKTFEAHCSLTTISKQT